MGNLYADFPVARNSKGPNIEPLQLSMQKPEQDYDTRHLIADKGREINSHLVM